MFGAQVSARPRSVHWLYMWCFDLLNDAVLVLTILAPSYSAIHVGKEGSLVDAFQNPFLYSSGGREVGSLGLPPHSGAENNTISALQYQRKAR